MGSFNQIDALLLYLLEVKALVLAYFLDKNWNILQRRTPKNFEVYRDIKCISGKIHIRYIIYREHLKFIFFIRTEW